MSIAMPSRAFRAAFKRSTEDPPSDGARSNRKRMRRSWKQKKVIVPAIAALVPLGLMAGSAVVTGSGASQAVVGSGFTVTPADLAYILKQIKIAEHHAATQTPDNLCGTLVGPDPVYQQPNALVSFGLRTVDGSCNNLIAGKEKTGASDQTFPRLTSPDFRQAEAPPTGFGPPAPTSYAQTSGNVFDSEPRTISNLIVDQTSTNPAAVAVAGFPPRTQGNPGVKPCTTEPTTPGGNDGLPPGCVPAGQTLDIPNVTTDVGLSPPFNALFTIFGQFFDHGLDKITNGGAGTVFVPLKSDDPLITSGRIGNAPPFMTVTRGTIVNTPSGRNSPNTDTPFVDQSQTYTSHASHQFFLREYTLNDPLAPNKPVTTGRFLSTGTGGMATWAMIKAQAAAVLGMQLVDVDVTNIPMVATDPYGNFVPGPNGFPQYVVAGGGLVEGNPAANGGLGVPAPANVVRINTAFLNDIAHSADPGGIGAAKNPDADNTAGGSLDPVAPGEYDDELLNLHYICGDGRCNENIGLTAIHQIFHMEHDRLVEEYSHAPVGANDPKIGTLFKAGNEALLADFKATNCVQGCATNVANNPKTFTYGERLFQAARFVTEMQYQHLVFEEFARKVQPAINPFTPFAFNQTDVNPAITAEFAHAVYRFGHSMLTDNIPRINAAGQHFDIPLFDAFLNPAAFNEGGLSDPDATSALIMGLSDETGQEIDEFVVEALRNNLLGLPLDLPAINMARARSEGIPRLNEVRRQIHAATNDGALMPYTNWVDFGLNIKHPQSLVNFVAAYGQHPLIRAATTIKGKRAAADNIVNGTPLPGPDNDLGTNCGTPQATAGCADNLPRAADADDFLFASGAWAAQETGVNLIDLWIGGLAEQTNLFGGLLGPTFNYVFEKQLTDLQNGDRFYYLARTPGMNLRSQLEGNSFAELIMRNTPAHTLKADPFATADCKFRLDNLQGTGSIVADDPTSECQENLLLVRFPDGTIKYRTSNSVDTPGLNPQTVFDGGESVRVDKVVSGVDNDTIWGGPGNDVLDGNTGDDVVLGGEGDDIITDLGGFDFLKGGPGNDAIDGGTNDDIIAGGDGQDFTNGGANLNETFSGPGNDFAIAGQGEDAIFGDGGDDWQEGGDQPDLLIGDSSTLFFDDHNLPGHDVLIGQGGDDDYDMEGGDDIGVDGPGIEKVAGASGWDWEIAHPATQPNAQPLDADLALLIVNAPPANEVRDRYNEAESLSGHNLNDKLRGDSIIPSQLGGGGFIGCDALDATGVARIAGLDQIVTPAMLTVDSATVKSNSQTAYCLLTGNVWGEGNILLGGAGSDILEGRGGFDVLDGDRYLTVRISVRQNADGSGPEIGSTDLMENAAVTGNFGAGTTGMTLQQAVFAGRVNPGQLVIVREILTAPAVAPDCGAATPANCDTAEFSGPRGDYTITTVAGVTTVTDNGTGRQLDDTDTLRNVERLSFCPTPGALRGTCDAPRTFVSLVPEVTVTPATITFANTPLNTNSTAQSAVITNTGLQTISFALADATITGTNLGDFSVTAVTPGCASIPAGGQCLVGVRFRPTAVGARTATLNLATPAGPRTVALTGTGVNPTPASTVNPTTLAFGNVARNTTSAPQVITFTNSGGTALTGLTVTKNGTNPARFIVGANTCTGTLAIGASCTVSVTFAAPNAVGNSAANININTAGNVANKTVAVTGTSFIPPVALSTQAVAFPQRNIGTTSAATAVNILNNSGAPLVVTGGISIVGPDASQFTMATTCATINNGGQCTVNVRFAPTTGNPANKVATLQVVTTAGTVTAALTGTAQAPAPTIGAIAPVDFGRITLPATAPAQTITVTNTGTAGSAPLFIQNTSFSGGPFTVNVGTCPTTLATGLAPGASCTMTVNFNPVQANNRWRETLTITTNAGNSPTAVDVRGRTR